MDGPGRLPGRAAVDVSPADRLRGRYVVKVFGAADYPARWRAAFAALIGVATIPEKGGGVGRPTGFGTTAVPADAEELARWIRGGGWADGPLARRLGVSRSAVCRFRTGTREITPGFRAWLAALEGDADK